MQPIQLWLPLITPSLSTPEAQRDMQRAFTQWSGESVVWLLPDIEEPCYWFDKKLPWPWNRTVAVPAEHLECVCVLHIGEGGGVFGAGAAVFPEENIAGLLNAWLNVREIEFVPFGSGTLQVPQITGDRVTYEEQEVMRKDRDLLVAFSQDKEMLPPFVEFLLQRRNPVSLEAEILPPPTPLKRYDLERYPFFGIDDTVQEFVTVRQPDADGTNPRILGKIPKGFGPPLQPIWPEPLCRLFPCGGSLDACLHHSRMSAAAQESANDLDRALHEAREWEIPYVTKGKTSPVFIEAADRLLHDPSWKSATIRVHITAGLGWIENSTEITRVWGPIGLFWALLLEQLEARRPYRTCKRPGCGRLIQGKQGKLFCNQWDNRACFVEHRRLDKEKERTKKRALQP
jgi:hypothetical protein